MSIGGLKERSGDLIVSDVKVTKKGLIQVAFSNGEQVKISQEAYSSAYLYPGKKLSTSDWNEILRISEDSSMKKYVESLLSFRDYAPKEVEDKLVSKFEITRKKAESLVVEYCEEGLLNPLNFAQTYAYELKQKGFSKDAVISRLKDKGISEEIIKSVLNSTEEDLSTAIGLVYKTYSSHPTDSLKQKEDKAIKKMIEKGYSSSEREKIFALFEKEHPECLDEENDMEALDKIIASELWRLKGKEDNLNARQKLIKKLLGRGFGLQSIREAMKSKE